MGCTVLPLAPLQAAVFLEAGACRAEAGGVVGGSVSVAAPQVWLCHHAQVSQQDHGREAVGAAVDQELPLWGAVAEGAPRPTLRHGAPRPTLRHGIPRLSPRQQRPSPVPETQPCSEQTQGAFCDGTLCPQPATPGLSLGTQGMCHLQGLKSHGHTQAILKELGCASILQGPQSICPCPGWGCLPQCPFGDWAWRAGPVKL